ncbi:MAG: radical SAM protein [Candidatus Cloacimonas sp.]
MSVQGESTYQGLPCIFIRFTGCNLRCSYCDTVYSYEEGTKTSIEQIIKTIEQYRPVNLVEITGGEPLLQESIYPLFEALHSYGNNILIETNGSQNLQNVPNYVVKIVDVKCPGSGEEQSFLIENLLHINPQDELKFVLSDYTDYQFAKNFIAKHTINTTKIHFSPVYGRLKPDQLAEWIVRDRLNVRLHIQLHKIVWSPDKRGV